MISPEPLISPQQVGNLARTLATLFRSGVSIEELRDELLACGRAAISAKEITAGLSKAALDKLVDLCDSTVVLGDEAPIADKRRIYNGMVAIADILDPLPRQESEVYQKVREELRKLPPQQRRIFEYFLDRGVDEVKIDDAFFVAIWGTMCPPKNALKEALRKCRNYMKQNEMIMFGSDLVKDGDYLRLQGSSLAPESR